MRERLEGKRYVEDYIGTLTHEMKSPLTAIQAASELLQEPMPEGQRQTFLTSISDQTRRLHILIEKMLQQASLENRQILERADPVDLVIIMERVAVSIRPKLEKKQLTLQLSLPADAAVRGDPFLLEQALLNVTENASDFSPRDGLLQVRLERQGNAWCLRLRDNGILMSEDYALLYGACLLFALLAAVMIFTRRVNWNEMKLVA